MKDTSFFKPWLEGNYQMPDLDELSTFTPDLEFLLWVSVNYKVPFHEINEEKILGLDDAWKQSRDYYHQAIELVQDYSPYLSLDKEECLTIIETLGAPPDVSHPIYIITVDDGTTEEVVYVGKSSSNHSRFNGGHATAIKLLHPKYDGKKKCVYLCQVMLNSTNDEYLPLEFVSDRTLAHQLLDDVESMVIDHFKPELNSKKMKTYNVKNIFSIQMQNVFTHSKALTDKFIWAKLSKS